MFLAFVALAGGAALAGIADNKYPDKAKQVGSVTVTPGLMVAGAGLALGALTRSPKLAMAGLGAVAFEAGSFAAQKTLPAVAATSSPAAVSGRDTSFLTTGLPAAYGNVGDAQFSSAIDEVYRTFG